MLFCMLFIFRLLINCYTKNINYRWVLIDIFVFFIYNTGECSLTIDVCLIETLTKTNFPSTVTDNEIPSFLVFSSISESSIKCSRRYFQWIRSMKYQWIRLHLDPQISSKYCQFEQDWPFVVTWRPYLRRNIGHRNTNRPIV